MSAWRFGFGDNPGRALPRIHFAHASLFGKPVVRDNLLFVGKNIPEKDDAVFQQFEKYTVMDSTTTPMARERGVKIILYQNGKRILDCPAGPASFTQELTALGEQAVACDPLYRFAAGQIAARVDETHPVMVAGMEAERERFVWTDAGSPARLGERRLAIMRRFLADYRAGLAHGRYVAAALPALPFGADEFDLALCSHLLFLYSAQLSADFHLAAIGEMLRVLAVPVDMSTACR